MPPPITRSHTTSISTSSAAISRRSRRSPHGRTPRRNVRRVLPKARCAARRHVIWLAHWAINCRWPSRRSRCRVLTMSNRLTSIPSPLPPPRRPKTVPDSPWKCWRPATAAMRRWISAIVIRPHRNGSHPSRAPLTIVGKRTRPPPCSPTPDTMLDSATGLTAPTDATIEMNCARSEITAIAGSSNAANDHSQSRVTNAKQSTDSRAQSLGVLAGLIADRVELALDWGYPSFDEALFV